MSTQRNYASHSRLGLRNYNDDLRDQFVAESISFTGRGAPRISLVC